MTRGLVATSICGLILAGCVSVSPKATFAGGDGTSPDRAIVIQGVPRQEDGIRAEHEWVEKRYPGAEWIGQRLGGFQGKPQDVITIRLKSGEERVVYFDISGFFGKMN